MKTFVRVLMMLAAVVAAAPDLGAQQQPAPAGEIRALASNGVKAVLDELLPQFERATGRRPAILFGTTASIKQRIEKGEAFDVVIVTSEAIDDLIEASKVARATRLDLARSGIGVGIRKGAPRPDIRTSEALKHTLLSSKSLTYAEDGASRVHIEKMLDRLGIFGTMKPRIALTQGSARGLANVAAGQGDLAMTLISEILPVDGVELLGPLPGEFQSYVSFAAAVNVNAKSAEAGTALIRFLAGPSTAPTYKTKGMEPPK
jgi:molybdate transport system substrate-binding protein